MTKFPEVISTVQRTHPVTTALFGRREAGHCDDGWSSQEIGPCLRLDIRLRVIFRH